MICPTGKSPIWLSSPSCKKNLVFARPKSNLYPLPSRPERGAYRDRHGRWAGCGGRGSVGRATGSQGGLHARERSPSALTNDAASGRRSRVVLTPRRRRQVCGRQVGPTGCGQASYPQMTVTRKPITGESTKQAVKTIACGNAGCSGGPVVTTRVLSTFAHEAAGAAGTPAFPTPSLGRKLLAKPRVHRAAGRERAFEGKNLKGRMAFKIGQSI